MIKSANAGYAVAEADAKGKLDVAKQACDAYKGVEKDACLSSAQAEWTASLANAVAIRDAALVDADRHE